MGANTRMDTLWHLARRGASLEVRCPGCRHTAFLDVGSLAVRMVQLRHSEDLSLVGLRLRCTACGRRGAQVRAGWQPGAKVALAKHDLTEGK